MRKKTIRSGLRFIIGGILCVILSTFFHSQISNLLFMGMADEGRLTFLGFFLGWVLSGWGAMVAVAGFVQSGAAGAERVRIAPTLLLLVSLVILFFVLAYDSITTPRVIPFNAPADTGGVASVPARTRNTLSPVHSATCPSPFNINASTVPAFTASMRARMLFK